MQADLPSSHAHRFGAALEVGRVFLKLGLTSFGGPVAHIGYFRREFVERRGWLDDAAFADLVALCQLLPGPASSQVGFSIGLLRAGWLGAVAAWCGFTLPSVALLLGFAAALPLLAGAAGDGLIHGLKLAAVAVVAQAVWDMARRLCPDGRRAGIALAAVGVLALLNTVYAQLLAIALGALLGGMLCRGAGDTHGASGAGMGGLPRAGALRVSAAAGALALGLFVALLFALPAWRAAADAPRAVAVFDAFYRSGALVFGGGHVVLPLLQHATVASGWVAPNDFLAGYGAAQALPGPLFAFAAFLGWIMREGPNRGWGALLATAGIFLPGMLLVVAALPHWQRLRMHPPMASALAGVNAAVVGLLASALYAPVWSGAVHSSVDFAVAAVAFVLLVRWKAPPLVVVGLCALAGTAMRIAV